MKTSKKLKTYHIKTYGCQMNYSDSERISTIMNDAGLRQVNDVNKADVIIFNTCSVRQSAEDRIFGLKKQMLKLKSTRDKKLPSTSYLIPITVLTGCIAQRSKRGKAEGRRQKAKYLANLKKKAPWIDIILPIKAISKLPKLLDIKPSNNVTMRQCNNGTNYNYLDIPPTFQSKFQAYIPISTGCNEFCSYCIVPYSRGKLINRPAQDIINDVKDLIKKGYKDIMLLGQNVNAYKNPNVGSIIRSGTKSQKLVQSSISEPCNFLSLLKAIDSIPGNFWLTFLSSHPNYFTTSLLNYFTKSINQSTFRMRSPWSERPVMREAESSRRLTASKSNNNMRSGDRILQQYHLRPYLNLALQSGSNEILAKMNRKYTVEKFINICKKLKSKIPNLMLSTDIIVGFPGETKKDFQKTAKVMEELEFDMAYINKYSPREYTAAAKLKNNVTLKVKKERAKILTKILSKTALKNNKKYVDKTVTILIDKVDKKIAFGRTFNFKNIKCKIHNVKSNLVGEFFRAKVTKAKTWSLEGEIDI